MSSLDNFRREAKRWLKALRAGDDNARARLRRAYPDAPEQPGLRDVQHALGRERGYESWIALKAALAAAGEQSRRDLERYEDMATDLLVAYESGFPPALQRLSEPYGRSITWDELRAGVRRRLKEMPESERRASGMGEGDFARPHARLLIARDRGFDNWPALVRSLDTRERPAANVTLPDAPQASGDLMIQPVEMRSAFPVRLRDGVVTTTSDVWNMLTACRDGHLERVMALVAACPSLVFCDYNYMSPLHLAVREGHLDVVRHLVNLNAANPNYVTYPYRETLVTVARDRGYETIAQVLQDAYRTADPARPEDEAGEVDYGMDAEQRRFQKLLNTAAVGEVDAMLKHRPDLALNPLAFWSEGVLMMPAKLGHRNMVELLMRHGARVPHVSKWGAWYYLWQYDIGAFLLEHDMNPNHMNCHQTTVLHDMAYKGDIRKAALLLDRGADINAVDQEFRSTPLALAARFGQQEMVAFLLTRGADPDLSGAPWATPLEWARNKGHAAIEAALLNAGPRSR